MWSEDECDFTAVTIGLWRLQQVLRHYAGAFVEEGEPREYGRRALLVPLPGEQHTFGIAMVAEFFRRAGWDVWSGPFATLEDLVEVVRSEWYAVIGISGSCETRIEMIAAAIRAVRRASRNRAIGVMVGGPLFNDHPERVALVGADATATDGRHAAEQAESLLGLLNAPAAVRQG
jgi:methylmalonyl-CoA mutase cobalamin-binding domain/chain